MTWIPHGPLWCWALQGADAMFFSQPSHAWSGAGETVFLDHRPACVARCQDASCFVLDELPLTLDSLRLRDGRYLTPDIQCGRIASLDYQGRFLCAFHQWKHWHCANCDAALPRDTDVYCTDCEALASEN